MMKTTFLLALAGVACVSSAAASQASGKIDPKQRAKIQPSDAQQRGKIEPGKSSGLTRRINLDKGMTSTAAEKIYASARLDDIERIVLKAVPEFGHLSYPTFTQFDGFHASAPKSNTILQYDYTLFADLGSGRYCSIFTASINHTPQGTDEPWPQGPRGKPVPGASFVLAELVKPPDPSYEQMLIVRDGETPYHQLTREEVRRWQIVDDEGANGEKLAKKKMLLTNTPYQRFMADAPDRQKTRDDLRAVLKGVRTPAEIDAQIKEMEDAERGVAKELKAQEADDRRQNDSISGAKSFADNARASIARMSAAERKLPAWVKSEANDTLYSFGTPESPHVVAYDSLQSRVLDDAPIARRGAQHRSRFFRAVPEGASASRSSPGALEASPEHRLGGAQEDGK